MLLQSFDYFAAPVLSAPEMPERRAFVRSRAFRHPDKLFKLCCLSGHCNCDT